MKNTHFLLLVFTFSASGLVQAQSPKLPGDTIFIHPVHFDDTTGMNMITLDTTSGNIWQIGPPSKTLFNQALSPPYALMTDTANTYGQGVESWFEINLGHWWGGVWLSFMHKYDTDTLADGGYITISWDNGLTWRNILHDSLIGIVSPFTSQFGWDPTPFNKNIYSANDSLCNHQPGFSGSSNGWVHTVLAWHYIPVKYSIYDTMILRFNFVSDSLNNNREGWMIDNLNVYAIELMGGMSENNTHSRVSVFPNPMNQSATLQLDQTCRNVRIEVYSSEGRWLESRNFSNTRQIEFEKQTLTTGLYFLRVHMDNTHQESLKLLIR